MADRRLWAVMTAATVLNLPLGSLYAFSIFLKPLETQLGATRSALAVVFALATVGFTVGMNVAPRLFGRMSAVALLATCVAAATAGFVIAAYATFIVVQQVVNLELQGSKGLANGYIMSLYPLGAMLSTPLIGAGIVAFGPRAMLLALAATLGVTGLAATALLALVRTELAPPAAAAETSEGTREDLRSIFWKIFAIFFLAAAAGLMVLSQAAGIIATYGGTPAIMLYGTSIITGMIAVARLSGGWLVDKLPVPFVMAFAHAFALTGSVVLSLWPGPMVAIVCLCMLGMGYGFLSGSTAAAITVYWPSGAFGSVAGRLYIAWCVAAVSLPVLAGHLFDTTGGYRLAVMIAGAGNILGLVFALSMPRGRAAGAQTAGKPA
jgi:OFA family oxalate/formate antiporter-like MFS transporter